MDLEKFIPARGSMRDALGCLQLENQSLWGHTVFLYNLMLNYGGIFL